MARVPQWPCLITEPETKAGRKTVANASGPEGSGQARMVPGL